MGRQPAIALVVQVGQVGPREDHPMESRLQLGNVQVTDAGDLTLVAEATSLLDQELAQRRRITPPQDGPEPIDVLSVSGGHPRLPTLRISGAIAAIKARSRGRRTRHPYGAVTRGTAYAREGDMDERDPLQHRWDLTPKEARAVQRELANRVVTEDRLGEVGTVAGLDLGFPRDLSGREVASAVVVVLSLPSLEVIEQRVAERPVEFPYVPGLLSFRESPVALAALELLETRPDVLIVDGQGFAHPRRFGIACHLGVLLDLPSIGCAKSILVGRAAEPGPDPGDWTPLEDRGETIGAALRTRPKTKPVYVSVGHRVSLETAVELVVRCGRGYRLPEPTRLADRVASRRG